MKACLAPLPRHALLGSLGHGDDDEARCRGRAGAPAAARCSNLAGPRHQSAIPRRVK